MRRLPVRFRPAAVDDLAEIFERIVRVSQNRTTAENYVRRIKARCDRVGNVPFGGRSRDDLRLGLRTVPFEGPAVIAYTIDQGCIWITNVFYGGRDYEALYHEEVEDE